METPGKKPFASSLSSKIICITGASRGIGAATAHVFAREGAHLALIARDADAMDKIAQQIRTQYPQQKVLVLPLDIADSGAIDLIFDRLQKTLGFIDILVNNAGFIEVAPFERISLSLWEKTLNTNLTGSFLCAQLAFRQMMESKQGGSIVNVSSLSGIRGVPKFKGFAPYIVSKHGLIGLTEALAVEGKPYRIRANAIAPGAVNTTMLKQVAPFLHTNTTPEDIAQSILFLADPKRSPGISGTVLEISQEQTG